MSSKINAIDQLRLSLNILSREEVLQDSHRHAGCDRIDRGAVPFAEGA